MPYWGRNDRPPPFWGHDDVPRVDPDAAEKAIVEGGVFVDVGAPAEWLKGHMPNAVLINPQYIDMEIGAIPKDRALVIVSRHEGLGAETTANLRRKGYDAALLEGGVARWVASGRALHDASGSPKR